MGKAIGKEAKHYGVHVVLGPAVNIKRNLKGARFYNTYFTATQITRTNMSDSVMQGCAVSAFDIKESCVQGAGFDNISRASLGLDECGEDEEWWLSQYRPDSGMTL